MTHALNFADLKAEYGIRYTGPGIYLTPDWYVLRVSRSSVPASKNTLRTDALVEIIHGPVLEDRNHPYCEDTNYTRKIMADVRGSLAAL